MMRSAQLAALTDDPRWARLQARDPSADGQFWYGVTTTGIFCRPTCGARLPRPEHVLLFVSTVAARTAGMRPCLRCDPEGLSRSERERLMVIRLCRLLESQAAPASLIDLAGAVGCSPGHVQRVFKICTGLTPKSYAAACRAQRLRSALATGSDVTTAFYQAGFSSSGRFYAQAEEILGMKPTDYRKGGAHQHLHFALTTTSLGVLLVAFSTRGVAAILLGDEEQILLHELHRRFPLAHLTAADRDAMAQLEQVVALIEGMQSSVDLPLDIRGTAFQQRVWQALRATARGERLSYSELARRIGAPKAVRAVASACAANALAVAIPCHRVVRSSGALSGYAWGIARKQALLLREAAGSQSKSPDIAASSAHDSHE